MTYYSSSESSVLHNNIVALLTVMCDEGRVGAELYSQHYQTEIKSLRRSQGLSAVSGCSNLVSPCRFQDFLEKIILWKLFMAGVCAVTWLLRRDQRYWRGPSSEDQLSASQLDIIINHRYY